MASLVWSSATPLPWLLRDIASEHEVSAENTPHPLDASRLAPSPRARGEGWGEGTMPFTDRHAHGAHQSDGADIPGSPTHPEDHDCAQCEVLKHLARCVMPDPAVPGVAALEAAPVKPPTFAESRYAFRSVTRPRIRGPPIDNA
jgi:hypothetical protein